MAPDLTPLPCVRELCPLCGRRVPVRPPEDDTVPLSWVVIAVAVTAMGLLTLVGSVCKGFGVRL